MEKIQRQATKMVPAFIHLPYEDRLNTRDIKFGCQETEGRPD